MRIVVLDADRSQADLICQVLTSAGHACHGYQTAKDLLANMRKDSVDMLILDWQVSDMDPAEVIRKAREKLPDNGPVMFLTTSSGELVPKATTVSPATNGLIPRRKAKAPLPLTSDSPPKNRSTRPPRIKSQSVMRRFR